MNHPCSLRRHAVSKLSARRVREARENPRNAADLGPVQGMAGSYNTRTEAQATFFRVSNSNRTDVDLPTGKCTACDPCGAMRLIASRQYWFQAFPFWQFHVLFNSLFKVLFIFPSRYLFAIGLSPMFSFRWYLPPSLGSNPKLPDSWKAYHTGVKVGSSTGFSPSMMPRSRELAPKSPPKTLL